MTSFAATTRTTAQIVSIVPCPERPKRKISTLLCGTVLLKLEVSVKASDRTSKSILCTHPTKSFFIIL